ncbi:3'(2'),5'-bisphosphate nucleotidase CysQ [Aeromonas simiae]|uniref:3'(2'),5'-bisphosphate nucleotidase CysQ n=1 Tax=Aeromonas simiae TaxID=218936 RepID=UPI0005A835C1|nr:3'(2'),5'-bisphosphate nucleotidase CysQ [Aeromonas simiae]MDO2949222.1 3'(2'),5'-bisphosphate nucleotidase CysQ [Aeromonas simiae]MDO2951204.1 3'(2'),5'-bisphosphate nucleotidase CysQ [Aeromonas simiae]MDO2956440.1 3'(2'),5'-bisphosphate nucleotidase CysQ [Aeromonas simiae]
MMLTTELRAAVCRVARAAGAEILDVYGQAFAVEHKADHSPLTEADHRAHDCIVQAMADLTPTIALLSEESPAQVQEARRQWHRYWLVDPLDGTKEFVSRNGEFTVNIALIEGERVVWGVVYAPVLDVLWEGGRELGAWREAQGERSAIRTVPHQEGERWRVVGSRHHLSAETLDYLAPLGDNLELISLGSSLKLCLVAEGKAHLYPRLAPTCEWDTAAAQAVVEGAGGKVTTLEGVPLRYNKPEILNPWFVVSASE